MKYIILYNPVSNSGRGKEKAEKLNEILSGEKIFIDVTAHDYKQELDRVAESDVIVLCGGDGTINRFINDVDAENLKNELLYYPTGSGNDFYYDVTGNKDGEPIRINEYVVGLPEVTVNGKTSKFLNGVGYGIDGYCCEKGDEQRKSTTKPVNYTAIAIKGLLYDYKRTSATVIVDDVVRTYKHVWLVPTMHGRCYGGGMIPTPDQDRLNESGTLSIMVYHSRSKIKALALFPKIFSGTHVKAKNTVEILVGKNITVSFDRPTALQIDGETVLGVTSCTMRSAKQGADQNSEAAATDLNG